MPAVDLLLRSGYDCQVVAAAIGAAPTDRPVLVTGADGQLGRTLLAAFPSDWRTVGLSRADLDITRAGAVREVVGRHRPWAIVNCASYNDVDQAESDVETALAVNSIGVRSLARAAADVDAVLVHYSSDFVFDGEGDRPYLESDPPAPRGVYAASKLLGEWFATDAPAHYILRVESLFGGPGRRNSSFDKIVAGILGGGSVRVFVDRTVSPSYVWDVATATQALLSRRPAYGLYHCVNSGAATWAVLADDVRRRSGVETTLVPVKMVDVPLPAPRPRYCALSNEKLRAVGIVMPAWQDAMDRYLEELGGDAESGSV